MAISQIEPAITGYSYLSASIGSRREGLKAGYMPKNRLPRPRSRCRMANDHHGREMGKPVVT